MDKYIKWHKLKQNFNNEYLVKPEDILEKRLNEKIRITPGMSVAITAGSRGIDRIDKVLLCLVKWLLKKGARPFIVPAMGSHGGADAQGQLNVLKGLNITEEFLGVPVVSSMETVLIDSLELLVGGKKVEIPVLMDKNAFKADKVIAVNRIKPHTSFSGEIESGIMKMLAVGLGKRDQADNIHKYGIVGLRDFIVPISRRIIDTGKILMGIGIVENAFDMIYQIDVFLPSEIYDGERNLLKLAKKLMPKLPSDNIDVLVVEKIGKNISGTGMDTNIIGRLYIPGEKEFEKPKIKNIIVTDLTKETGGNAYGMGLADFITEELFNKIDFASTYMNAITSTFLERAKVPLIAKDEEDAFLMALTRSKISDLQKARVVKIENTLRLSEVLVSGNILNEYKQGVSL